MKDRKFAFDEKSKDKESELNFATLKEMRVYTTLRIFENVKLKSVRFVTDINITKFLIIN